MANLRFILLALIVWLACVGHAYEPKEGKINITVGHLWFKTHYLGPMENDFAPWQGGLGLIATGDSGSKGSVELSFFQMSKRFIRKSLGFYTGEKSELIQINMGYRWWLSSYISTALSFYSSYTMGSPHTFYNDYPASQNLKTSAQDTTEYGFDFSVQTQLWESGLYGAVLEPRYSYSVTKKFKESGDHFGVFLGLRYLVQAKEKNKE